MAVPSRGAPSAAIFGLAGKTLSDDERAFFSDVQPLGYILFARNVETPTQVRALVDDLRGLVAGHDPVVLIDQEGGRVQRLKPPHWRFAPPMADFGALYTQDKAAAKAALSLNNQLIGQELADLGIDVDCAPVMDVPVADAHDIIGNRAFSRDPHEVADMAIAACDGLIAAGVVPVIKHIPGHGRARADSHLELPVVEADLASLRASDFVPFAAFPKSGRPAMAMTAHVVYTAIDPDKPATTSAKVIGDIVRGEFGFKGLLMSDDLGMKALGGPYDQRTSAALAAGCDVVLHCDGNLDDMRAVAKALRPLGPNGLRAMEDLAAVRRKPRETLNAAAGQAAVTNALRRA